MPTKPSRRVNYQELAKEGHTFMLAYAPSELDTERLMNVVRRFRFKLAQKYERFALQELPAK